MTAWATWTLLTLALGGLLGGQLPVEAPPAASAASPEDGGGNARDSGDDLLRPQQPPGQPDQNATNATTIPGFGNGTTSHHHGSVGDQGLGAVWATVFHGVPAVATSADVDGDGTLDALVGTDLSVNAVSGATGSLLWARHLGSTVTSIFTMGEAGDVKVGFSTLWEAQTPRVGLLRGADGAVLWEHVGPRPFLTAAAAADDAGADVVAVDIGGVHMRLSGATGEPIWEFDVDLLPDDPTNGAASGVVHANLGHHLAKAADLNGDSVTDTVSVGNHQYVSNFNRYAIVHAVDGATGERLWLHNVGGDPNTVSQALVHDIEALDAQGDGSADIAVSFLVLRVPLIVVPFGYHWEQGIRIIKGDSPNVGVPIGAREFITPVLPLDEYPDLDHTDVDGDGRDEVAALRQFVANGVLGGDAVTYERYAMPIGSPTTGTLLLVSDVTIGAGSAGRLSAFDLDGDGGRDHGVSRLADGNASWTVVTHDGQVLGPYDMESEGVRAATAVGARIAVATRGALELRPAADLGAIDTRFPLRGAPRIIRLADADQDATPDLFVLATDGFVHIVDGVTGIASRSVFVGEGVTDFQVADLGGGPAPDLVVTREDPEDVAQGFLFYASVVEGIDGDTGEVEFSRPSEFAQRVFRDVEVGALWFDGDGDGDHDLLHTWQSFSDTLGAVDGSNGRDLWSTVQEMPTNGPSVNEWAYGEVVRLDGEGEDLVLASRYGILAVDGMRGRTLGWHPITDNGTFDSSRGPVACMGAADGDADGNQTLFAIHDGSVGDLARMLVGEAWEVLDWIPDESEVMRCDLRAVANGDGSEDLLASMVWVTSTGDVSARIGRFDVSERTWVWEDVQRRPDIESEAYFALGVMPDEARGGTVFLAWQDHVYALQWANGSVIGEFTVNGPFVLAGTPVELDGIEPGEAVILAADGIIWALAEDRAAVATRLAAKADEDGKPNNYGAGSSFEAPPAPPPKKGKKSFIPGPSLALLAAALVGVAMTRAQRGNR